MLKVYVWCELGDDEILKSPEFELSESDYEAYLRGEWLDSEVWPEAWLEFEDQILEEGSSCIELVEESV